MTSEIYLKRRALSQLGMSDAKANLAARKIEDPLDQRAYDHGRKRWENAQEKLAKMVELRGTSPEVLMAMAIERLYGSQTVSGKPAQGVSGCLLRGIDKDFFFRVYKHSKEERIAFSKAHKDDKSGMRSDEHVEMFSYTDYEIRHFDMEITITEDRATLYENVGGEHYIDYDPETLTPKFRPASEEGTGEAAS